MSLTSIRQSPRAERWEEPACWTWDVPAAADYPNPLVSLFQWHAGRCAVCGDHVRVILEDHDHETGLTRGWLCRPCNQAEAIQAGVYSLYRERHPALILGVTVRYANQRKWGNLKPPAPWRADSSVLYMKTAGADLTKIGNRRARAKAAYEKVNDEAKRAVVAAAAEGVSETELARVMKVDRMTIRSWLGKRG